MLSTPLVAFWAVFWVGPACVVTTQRQSRAMARAALLAALLALALAASGATAAATPPSSEDWVAASAVFEARRCRASFAPPVAAHGVGAHAGTAAACARLAALPKLPAKQSR